MSTFVWVVCGGVGWLPSGLSRWPAVVRLRQQHGLLRLMQHTLRHSMPSRLRRNACVCGHVEPAAEA